MGDVRQPTQTRPRAPPRRGTAFVAVGTGLAAFAILTGLLDILLPKFTGGPTFGTLVRLAETFGPSYLFTHIFLHNLGLAFLLPGIGFLAAAWERDPRNRRIIAHILAAAVLLSLVSATELVVRRGYWKESIVIPLLLVEAGAVLLLTWAGWRALQTYIPTRRAAWSWVKPARDLLPYAVISTSALAFAAFVETLYLARTLGL